MRKCLHCGAQNYDVAKECSNCHFPLDPIDYKEIKRSYQTTTEKSNNNLKTVAKVFLLIGTILLGVVTLLFTILWGITISAKDPLSMIFAIYMLVFLIFFSIYLFVTIYYCKKINEEKPVGLAFKICVLIFISPISGILMLCDADN